MDIQSVGFLAKTLELTRPGPAELEQAYRALSAQGSLVVACTPEELASTLGAAERAGFYGIWIEPGEQAKMTAHKGKEGPCYDTGRTARYRGTAAAAMDDDHHLLYGKLRVCEKTGRLYSSAAYRGQIEVSEPDESLYRRLGQDPAPFDCDTFEADAKTLAASLSAAPISGGPTHVVYYPGPFRLLILTDGSMVRRGRPVRIAADLARALAGQDGALLDPAGILGTPVDAANYSDLYRARGAACLLEPAPPEKPPPHSRPARLEALDEASEAMRRRLGTFLSRGDEYFILTGSDPSQKEGCCPSNEVGNANQLVEAGILESHGAASGADCPVTIYAFAGEIREAGASPTFIRNEALRERVQARLRGGRRMTWKAAIRLAFLAAWAIATATLLWAVYRQVRG